MAYGITLALREIKRPAPEWIVRYNRRDQKTPYVNPDKDRTLAGKARRKR